MDSDSESRVDFLVIGGGVAGLSAALHLAKRGASTLLVEAGSYPAHRVCGEFLSPESLSVLRQFAIDPPCRIHGVRFAIDDRSFDFSLPEPAGSMARYQLDALLAQRLCEHGGRLLTEMQATHLRIPLEEGNPFFTRLSDGREVESRALIVGTGRLVAALANHRAPKLPYVGLKAHFHGLQLGDLLEMHVLKGGYAGISMIDDGTANVALLMRWGGAKPPTPALVLERAPQLKKRLEEGRLVFTEWMSLRAPEFGMRKTPPWPNSYFLGDAAGTIPPASGDGLAMALTSGELAAAYALEGDWQGYRKAWKACYSKALLWGKLLHWLMLHPRAAKEAMSLAKRWPSLAQFVFQRTRGVRNI